MPAGTRALEIEQGATYILSFRWHHEDPDLDDSMGAPRDLTGWTARMQIRETLGGTPLVDASTENGMIILGAIMGDLSATPDPTNGRIVIFLSDEATEALTVQAAVYDLVLVHTSPRRVKRLLQGSVTISPRVTEAPEDAGGMSGMMMMSFSAPIESEPVVSPTPISPKLAARAAAGARQRGGA